MSEGTIKNTLQEFKYAITDEVERIKVELKNSPLLHVASNDLWTYYHADMFRGKKGVDMNSAGRLTDQIEIDRCNSRYDQLLELARQEELSKMPVQKTETKKKRGKQAQPKSKNLLPSVRLKTTRTISKS